MQAIEFLRQRILLSAALAGMVAGTAVGMALPIHASAPDAAELGEWIPYGKIDMARFSEAEFAKVRSARIWGDQPGAAGAQTVQWQLTGIIAGPKPGILVATKGNKQVQQLGTGAQLPDGGKIIEITRQSVRFTRSGCSYERSLYAAVDPAEGDGCNPGDAGALPQVPER